MFYWVLDIRIGRLSFDLPDIICTYIIFHTYILKETTNSELTLYVQIRNVNHLIFLIGSRFSGSEKVWTIGLVFSNYWTALLVRFGVSKLSSILCISKYGNLMKSQLLWTKFKYILSLFISFEFGQSFLLIFVNIFPYSQLMWHSNFAQSLFMIKFQKTVMFREAFVEIWQTFLFYVI